MNKQSGLAPLIIVLIVAAAVVGIVGGGIGGYRVVSRLKEAKQAYEAGPSREPAVEISRATGTESSIAQEEKQTQKEAPAVKKEPAKASVLPPPYKTFEFETTQQNVIARLEAPRDWSWKEGGLINGDFICRPQSRGYGCVWIYITKGAADIAKEARTQFEDRKSRHPDTTFRETIVAGRNGYLWEEKYEAAVGVPREYYLNPELYPNVQKKWVTDRGFYFSLPGFDFYAIAKDFGAFADQPEVVNTFDKVIGTFRLIDASEPVVLKPEPTEQRPTLPSVSDEKWCAVSGPITSINPLTGIESAIQVYGVESIQVGPAICRACHKKSTEKPTGYYIETWSNLELWDYLGLPSKWGCAKAITAKEGQSVYEKWSTEIVPECVKQDGNYLSGNAAVCE